MKNILGDLKLALYCASIIIGAGLLTLPLSAANLGFGPLIIAIILLGLYMIFLNRRITSSLYAYLKRSSRQRANIITSGINASRGNRGKPFKFWITEQELIANEVRERGTRQWVEQARDAGFGNAGRWCILLGMFFYVFFADIGYVILGSRSLSAIASFAEALAPQSFTFLLIGGGIVLSFSLQIERIFTRPFLLRGTIKKVAMMFAAWMIGIAFLGFVHQNGILSTGRVSENWAVLLALLLFTAAVLAGMYTRVKETAPLKQVGLSDQHTVNVFVVLFEMALLLVTIGIVVWTVISHQTLVAFEIFPSQPISLELLSDGARMVGLVIFAYVGTGLFNLCSYSSLFETRGHQNSPRLTRVVVLGTLIPMFVYLLWTLTSAIALPREILLQLDSAKEYTTIGLARTFGELDPTAALLITLFGYSVALLAVTSACNGFTESLADQISVFLNDEGIHNRITESKDNLHLRLIILLGAMITAFTIDRLIQINISTILAVAGIAGGGLLVLILPFFLPPPGHHKTPWTSIMVAFSSAIVLTLLGLNAANLPQAHDLVSGIVPGVSAAIALTILGMTVWMIRSEPKANIDVPFTESPYFQIHEDEWNKGSPDEEKEAAAHSKDLN